MTDPNSKRIRIGFDNDGDGYFDEYTERCPHGDYVHWTDYRDAVAELELWRSGFIAADQFIGSHVADPDMTEEMCYNYSAYLDAKKLITEKLITPFEPETEHEVP